MTNQDKIDYWVGLAEYDLETARALLDSKRYLYVGFMCHQVVEKMLKAVYVSIFNEIPPKTLNQKQCNELIFLTEELSNWIRQKLSKESGNTLI